MEIRLLLPPYIGSELKFLDGGGVKYGSGTGMCLGTKSNNAVKGNIRKSEV